MLDLTCFFNKLNDYAIIRIDKNFPKFNIGADDIDILCLDINATCKHIINVLQKKYPHLRYRRFLIDNKTHIDISFKNRFIIKFDLCDDIRKLYPKYNIPTELTKEVIKTSILNDKGCSIPIIENELMLRQLEYDTHIKDRPDKIKHLKFIKQYADISYRKFNIRF